MRARWLAALAGGLLLLGCRTVPKLPMQVELVLRGWPGASLTGTPVGLGPPLVLNAEDFVYDARFSPSGDAVAFARLGSKQYFVSWFDAPEQVATKRFDVPVNPYEFDVEMVAFSPDGAALVTVSRDGAVRAFDAKTGGALRAWSGEEPLVSVAFAPGGTSLVVGSVKGLVTALSWPSLQFLGEVRAHTDEVRGLVFRRDGAVISGGWDKRLATWVPRESPSAAPSARVHVDVVNGVSVFRAALDGGPVRATIDARLPVTVVRSTAGLSVPPEGESITIPTAMGQQVARVAKAKRVSLKGLVLESVDVAVCDACLPAGVALALGQPEAARLEVAIDAAAQELVVSAKAGAAGVVSGASLELVAGPVFTFPAAVNDVSIDAAGKTLGVAFSETKAERTREVYEREKRKDVEPERPWDCGARVDAVTGEVLQKLHGHRGVVATAGVSPDGKSLVTGGWDKRVLLHGGGAPAEVRFGWAVRRARFSPDARRVVVAAWTPQNPLGDHQSDPSAVVVDVAYAEGVTVVAPSAP